MDSKRPREQKYCKKMPAKSVLIYGRDNADEL